jgi:CcmD family protein
LLTCGGRTLGAAQPAPGQPPLEGFVVADDQAGQEQLPATPLVLTAYGVAWVAVLFYVWLTWRRLAKVEGELQQLAKKAAAGPKP